MEGGEGRGEVKQRPLMGSWHWLQLFRPHSVQLKSDWSAQVPGGQGTHVRLPGKPAKKGGVSTDGEVGSFIMSGGQR